MLGFNPLVPLMTFGFALALVGQNVVYYTIP